VGVDLAAVSGTGPGGAITVADVERASASKAPVASDRSAAMRAAIAAAMTRSKRDIPHFYLSTSIEMTRAETWLTAENAQRPVAERLLPVVLLLKAVARGLVDVPELNGFWMDGAFKKGSGIHVGCAISLRGGGLVAPALHDVDKKPLATLMTELRDLVNRARSGSLRSSELSDSTITVTNLGDMGVESTYGVIFPPQVALVAFGKVMPRPWAVGDVVAVRPVMTTTLSADHRAVDGHRGGLFLWALDRALQEPERL
jgi:pyruvate dehydrogenase E2 component (dihydrolipoamide acetyltransferase)